MPTVFFLQGSCLAERPEQTMLNKGTAIQYYPNSSVSSQCLICHSGPALEPETPSQEFSSHPHRCGESVTTTHDFTEGELRAEPSTAGLAAASGTRGQGQDTATRSGSPGKAAKGPTQPCKSHRQVHSEAGVGGK